MERSWVLSACYQVAVCSLWNIVLFCVEVRGTQLLLMVDCLIKKYLLFFFTGLSSTESLPTGSISFFPLTSGLTMGLSLVSGRWEATHIMSKQKLQEPVHESIFAHFPLPQKQTWQMKVFLLPGSQNHGSICSQHKANITKTEGDVFVFVKQ